MHVGRGSTRASASSAARSASTSVRAQDRHTFPRPTQAHPRPPRPTHAHPGSPDVQHVPTLACPSPETSARAQLVSRPSLSLDCPSLDCSLRSSLSGLRPQTSARAQLRLMTSQSVKMTVTCDHARASSSALLCDMCPSFSSAQLCQLSLSPQFVQPSRLSQDQLSHLKINSVLARVDHATRRARQRRDARSRCPCLPF